MKKGLTKHTEEYSCYFMMNGTHEELDVRLNTETGQIQVKIYEDRWRMPDETIKFLKEVINEIEKFNERQS